LILATVATHAARNSLSAWGTTATFLVACREVEQEKKQMMKNEKNKSRKDLVNIAAFIEALKITQTRSIQITFYSE
jgi:hypothetical protein